MHVQFIISHVSKKSIISQDIYCSCVIYLRVRTDVEIRTITEVRNFDWLLLPAPIHAEISTATMSFAKAPQMIRELFIIAATLKNVLRSHGNSKKKLFIFCSRTFTSTPVRRELLSVAAKYMHLVCWQSVFLSKPRDE